MSSFIRENDEVDAVLTVLSGELLAPFYQQLAEALPDRELRFYGSPVTIEETIGLGADFPAAFAIEGFTGWYNNSGLEENTTFSAKMRGVFKEPNAFSALGWDTGLILQQFFQLKEAGALLHALPQGSVKELGGAKGTLRFHEESHHFTGDAYLLKHSSTSGTELLQALSSDEGSNIMNKMITQKIEGMTSGWLNTYLCS